MPKSWRSCRNVKARGHKDRRQGKMSFSFKKGTCQQTYHGYNHQAVEKYGFCVGHIKRIVGEGVRTLMYIAWDSNEMWRDTNLTKHFENELDLVE